MDKSKFAQVMRDRTKGFAIGIIKLSSDLTQSTATRNIIYQITRSATSTGANYRAVCRSRSKAEFFAKLSLTIEECDETIYWLEIINDLKIYSNKEDLDYLVKEGNEIVRILSAARKSTSKS